MSINEVLHKMQMELKVPKGQKNTFGNYKYRSCEDILEAVKKVLDKGSALRLCDEMVMLGDRFYVKATARLSVGSEHLECCGWARESETKKGMDAAQITGAASSYARKYALNGLFAIDDTKDADTDEHRKNKQKAEKDAAKQELEEKRKKAETWANNYLNKINSDLDESELINLQQDNTAMLKRIAEGYPDLHATIARATNEVRGV